jgi:predicted RNA-binding protein with PIN domain
MRIFIDGYNLIRRIPELREADRVGLREGREALLKQLASYKTGKGHLITVVFDGTDSVHLGGTAEKVRGIKVLYSPRGRNADRIILEAFRGKEVDLLVSADRELVEAARRDGVTAVSPDLFWDKVQSELYYRLKGEALEEQGAGHRAEGGRKLSKAQRKDRQRIAKL